MLEIRAGAGGNEACIWAGDLARMYERYGQKIGWSVKPISASESDMAISDSEALIGLTDHPIFCPYLSYILAKSPAHIQASLPPAPALISNITLLSSLGSFGNNAIVVF